MHIIYILYLHSYIIQLKHAPSLMPGAEKMFIAGQFSINENELLFIRYTSRTIYNQ